ncbi:hypothetical protein EN35_01285 [Rhodococcus qingshengii]|nr:hypothetical protein EN35_01285 [Rhodococcus qingshengii]
MNRVSLRFACVMDAASRILTGNYCNPPEVKKNTPGSARALKRLATGDWRDEYDAHIPRLFNPGILRDINNIVINQRTTSRFCEDGDKVRFWIHFTNRNRSTTGIHQVINNDEAFAIAFCAFQHFKLALVVVIVAGNTNGIDMTNTQFTRQ